MMTMTAPGARSEDFEHGDSLGDCMRRVYLFHLKQTTEGETCRPLALDWPRSEGMFRAALRRMGGRAWFVAQWPDEEGPPGHVLAEADPKGGPVRFRPATDAEVRQLPSAHRFALDGSPIPGL